MVGWVVMGVVILCCFGDGACVDSGGDCGGGEGGGHGHEG